MLEPPSSFDWQGLRLVPSLWVPITSSPGQVAVARLDRFRGYLNALRHHLPDAAHVLDAVHVTALGMKALDEVRGRVQQDTLGDAVTRATHSTRSAVCSAAAPTGSPHLR
jgi:hypothetical protein